MKTSIKSNNFAIKIHSNYVEQIYDANLNYITLDHNSEYKIELCNYNNVKADANIKVDGRNVGKFRINANSSIIIERPVSIDKKFTFLRENSRKANRANIEIGRDKNGLIEVIFYPEKSAQECMNLERIPYTNDKGYNFNNRHLIDVIRHIGVNNVSSSLKNATHDISPNLGRLNENIMLYNNSFSDFASGATALGSSSHQRFKNAKHIDVDKSNITIIKLRLIANNKKKYNPEKFPIMSNIKQHNLFSMNEMYERVSTPPRIDTF